MEKSGIWRLLACLMGFYLLTGAPAVAQPGEHGPIVLRMQERHASIHQLRTGQKAGEGMDGFLVSLDSGDVPPGVTGKLTAGEKELLTQENNDRKQLYAMLAEESKTSPERIGAIRASLLRGKAGETPAFWYQLPGMGGYQWAGPKAGPPPPDLPLYVLTGPGASLHRDAGSPEVKTAGLPIFKAYLVLNAKKDAGGELWYEVAEGLGAGSSIASVGWIARAQAMPWDHRMVVEYTGRGDRRGNGRGPVLFFDKKEPLEELLADSSVEARRGRVAAWTGNAGGNGGPVGREPDTTPIASEVPYVMPVFAAEQTSLVSEGTARDAHIVRLASVSRPARTSPADLADPGLDKLNIDVVFVMDTTGSMQPHIDALLRVVSQVTSGLSEGAKPRFRFGFIGYQDDDVAKKKFGIQYLAENFTKSGLQEIAAFQRTLSGIKANRITGDEYEEDVLAGILKAVNEVNWTPEALRLIVHAGDAPPLKPRRVGTNGKVIEPGSRTRLSLEGVRSAADDRGIGIFSIQIEDPQYVSFHGETEREFKRLATNKGVQVPAFFKVAGSGNDQFEEAAKGVVNGIIAYVLKQLKEQPDMFPVASQFETVVNAAMGGVFEDWRSRTNPTAAPQLREAYTLSLDCAPPHNMALDVCVALNRLELRLFHEKMSRVTTAARDGAEGDEIIRMLEEVRQAVVDVFRDPRRAGKSPSIVEDLKRLPYKSPVMDRNAEWWDNKNADEKEAIIGEWQLKTNYYQELFSNGVKWFKPRDNADSDEEWTAVKLALFP